MWVSCKRKRGGGRSAGKEGGEDGKRGRGEERKWLVKDREEERREKGGVLLCSADDC